MRAVSLPGVSRPISRIVLGMSAAPDELPALYDRFVELGGNAFETARWYPAEPTLGAWLAGRSDRDELVIIGKAGHPARRRTARHGSTRPRSGRTSSRASSRLGTTGSISSAPSRRSGRAGRRVMTALAEQRGSRPDRAAAVRTGRRPARGGDRLGDRTTACRRSTPRAPTCARGPDPAAVARLPDRRRSDLAGLVQRAQLPLFAWSALARGYLRRAVDAATIRGRRSGPARQDIECGHGGVRLGRQPASGATVPGSSPTSSG